MRIIEGYKSAVPVLSRQVPTDVYPEELENTVRQIIDEVRQRGDAALRDYALKFDGVKLASLEVGKQSVADAYRQVSAELVAALRVAAGRIRVFHMEQKRRIRRQRIKGGSAQIMRPLERVGLYVPGGTAAYPSTVLMTAIPAKVAGV
ncbi:MAG: histidinol dehydrogenase, partial [Chloroflexi bacterium]|nr:histidinol dehydrogenase [Chloroflexota bacterium]